MALINTWPGWECVGPLGAGAFGKVYEIQKEESGKIYKAALKVISIPQDESDIESAYSEGMSKEEITSYFRSFVNNITNEFALMSDLKGYTNIVSYEDHMVVEREDRIGWHILIRMELLTPLHKWITSHPMDEKEIIRLGCDICRALELCQSNKIIHRDIKPENIFVNKTGDFKLGDFGIARVVEKTSNALSQQRGTYTYMAPEVYKGQHYNQTADIYSLGIVLYRFLNNNRTPILPQGTLLPTDREKAQDRRMSGEQIPAPLNGSENLKQAVLLAIAYDPNKRIQNARAFRMALEQCSTKIERAVSAPQGSIPIQEAEPIATPVTEDEHTCREFKYIPPSPKKKNWLIPAVLISIVAVVGIVALITMSSKTDNPSILPDDEPKEPVQEELTVSETETIVEFNEFFLNFKGMTYGQYKENTGKEAQWMRGEIFEAELSGSRLSIVFQSSPPSLIGDAVDYHLYDEDKSLRVQGSVREFLIDKNTDMKDGIHYLDLADCCVNNVELIDVQVGNYASSYTLSDYYVVYLFEFDDNERTQVELHIDMTHAKDGIIRPDAMAWVVFRYEEQEMVSPAEMVKEQIRSDVIADYGNNLNPYNYQYYESEVYQGFNFYYPGDLYNDVDVTTNGYSDEYGTILEEFVFRGSDNASKAVFQLKKRENTRTVAQETQKIFDYYENNIPGFQKLTFSNEDATKPGRIVVTGMDSVGQVCDYILVTVTEEYIMTMRVVFPSDGKHETEDFKEKEYLVECMYRLCGFSGSSYKARTYVQFLNGESGEKK